MDTSLMDSPTVDSPIVDIEERQQARETLYYQMIEAVNETAKAHPPVVMLHGWGSSSNTWRGVVDQWVQNRSVMLIDLPGFGRSQPYTIPVSVGSDPEKYLEHTLLAIEAVLPESCILMGWSLGGMLATRLAYRNPSRVKSLITLATNLTFVQKKHWPQAMMPTTFIQFYENFSKNSEATFKRFCQLQGQGDTRKRQVVARLRADQPWSEQIDQALWLAGLTLLEAIDNTGVLSALEMPCLHLLGDKDGLVPASVQEAIHQCAPLHHVEILENAGHAFHVSYEEQTSKKILRFLSDDLRYKKNKEHMAEAFDGAAQTYDDVALLQREVVDRLIENFSDRFDVPSLPGVCVDLGCGTGYILEQLHKKVSRVTTCHTVGIDIAPSMVQYAKSKTSRKITSRKITSRKIEYLCADIEQLPFTSNSIDLCVSSLSMQWCEQLELMFNDIYRALTKNGTLIFATLGPRTLFELQSAWAQVDSDVHVNRFMPMNSVVKAFESGGFLTPRTDHYQHSIYYETVVDLMQALKKLGAHNVNAGMNKGLTGKQRFQKMQHAYETYRDPALGFPATYEVLSFVLCKAG